MAEKEDENTQTYHFYLVYNWKQGGKPKIYKHDPEENGRAGPYDIVEEVTRTIKKPEKPKYQSKAEIEIPEAKIQEMVAEEL